MKFKVNLKELLDKKGITKYKLSKISGIPESTLTKYYKDTAKGFNSEVLAKLCIALDCKIEDLLVEIK